MMVHATAFEFWLHCDDNNTVYKLFATRLREHDKINTAFISIINTLHTI